jgi:hypothetical protein
VPENAGVRTQLRFAVRDPVPQGAGERGGHRNLP